MPLWNHANYPPNSFCTVCERDGKWLQSPLVGVTVTDVPLLKTSQFHPRYFHQVNIEGKNAWRTSVQSLELVTPSPPIAPAKKGRSIRFIWIAHAYLYEQVTELLLGGHCLTFNRAHRLTESLQQLVGCRNYGWHQCCLHSLSTGLFQRASLFDLEFAS